MSLTFLALCFVGGILATIAAASLLQAWDNRRWLRRHQEAARRERRAMGVVEDKKHLGL